MRRVLFAVALTAVAISVLTTPSGATAKAGGQAVSAPGDYSLLRNSNSFKCLVAQNAANNAPAFQYQCNTQFDDQYWRITLVDNDGISDYYRIHNRNGGKCLVAQNFGNGSPAFQYDCGPYEDQYWRLVSVRPAKYQLENVLSQKCLVVQGPEDGNRAFLYTCFAYADQEWYFDGGPGL